MAPPRREVRSAALSEAELAEMSSRADCLIALSQLYETMGELHPDLKESGTENAGPGKAR